MDRLTKFGLVSLAVGSLLTLGACDDAKKPAKLHILARATCGANDRVETGLQGQIPAAERAAGFGGFNCNLEKLGNVNPSNGYGIYRQFAMMRDKAGHVCGYSGGALRQAEGTTVVDFTDPNNPVETETLKTPGMMNPGEGLRTHQGRGLLVSAFYINEATDESVPHGFDVYDVGTDCRHPQLLSTTTELTFPTEGLALDKQSEPPSGTPAGATRGIYGHEGAISPDGLTYYVAEWVHGVIHVIDISNPVAPKYLAVYRNPAYKREPVAGNPLGSVIGGHHGLSISNDGNRIYPVSTAYGNTTAGGMVPQTGEWHNGFYVVDSSEIQARKPNPKLHVISDVSLRDQSYQQLTIPVRIKGKPYLITGGEGGTGQLNTAGMKAACAAGLTPFSLAHIFDMSDEKKPKFVNKLLIEVNDPANCAAIDPEITTIPGLIYDLHMCSVDNRDDATTLACSYWQSGIRIYDIRDPKNIKEIAYYNPGVDDKTKQPGWCGAIPFLDAEKGIVYSSCADGGSVVLKFTNNVWPFPESKTPVDKQL